ncbi:MAG TPA: c-type cytochrome [Aliiroseovarius sp.]|nr:c-type cytochrome [Aliiroseovarius sp.]
MDKRKIARFASACAVALLATPLAAHEHGDPERGAELFKACKACHQVGEGAKNRVGPVLNGIFGRPAGAVEGFRYSRAMNRMAADGLVWTWDTLDAFVENPKQMVSRTKMSYRGMKDAQDRADLLAFLRLFSDNPADIPEAEPTDTSNLPNLAPEILALVGDPAYGEYLASECTTCHKVDGSDDGIPSITGWPTEDFVLALHAYKQKLRPHPVMQMMAGRLSDEEIAALAAYFNGL